VPDENLCDTYTVTVKNIGALAAKTTAVTIEDMLPVGVKEENADVFFSDPVYNEEKSGPLGPEQFDPLPPQGCAVAGQVVTCTVAGSFFASVVGHGVLANDTLKLFINVSVENPGVPRALVNTARVFGGGVAGEASASSENTVGGENLGFGVNAFSAPLLNDDGQPESQAGGHPYELDTGIDFNSVIGENPEGFVSATSVHPPKDVVIDLPVGVVGSAVSAPQCTLVQLSTPGPVRAGGEPKNGESGCPTDTIIGHIRAYPNGLAGLETAIYNVVPEKGVAAELGFVDLAGGAHVLYATVAPTPEGYALRSWSHEIPSIPLTQVVAEVYGDPAARDHVIAGEAQAIEGKVEAEFKAYAPQPADVPTFTNPSDCTGEPLKTRIFTDSWSAPGSYTAGGAPNTEDPRWAQSTFESPPVTGCEALEGSFAPGVQARAQPARVASPTGLSTVVSVPQSTGVEVPATPPVKEAVVTLPAGVNINPSSANGLQACSEAQIGWLGKSPIASGEYENFTAAAPECPNASKVGTVEVETPALPAERCKNPFKTLAECTKEEEANPGQTLREKTPLQGSLYLAREHENPFGSLLAGYLAIDDPRTGVIAKVPAEIEVGGEEGVSGLAPGQLRTSVKDAPQFPFSTLRVNIFGGEDAPLRSPETCGSYTLTSTLTPWSATAPASPSSSLAFDEGADGGSCPGAPALTPSLSAGTSFSQGGAFAALSLKLTREEGSQEFKNLEVTLPPGLIGKTAGIQLCGEQEIQRAEARSHPGEGMLEKEHPSCPAASEVGSVTVGVGAGGHLYYTTGHAYLAGPYIATPSGQFDLVVITPAVAGPFDLGTVVVRNALRVNPNTAQVTATSGAFPTSLQGIPVDLRSIVLDTSRPGFILNPTNCQAMSITGQVTSTTGQTAGVSTPFKASGCEKLPFAPHLAVSVTGQGSKADGTSFTAKITTPGIGQADIHKVDLTIPARLPSRLSTINKACLESVFNANPAACDEGSVIGEGIVHTPLLENPLAGPAYLVSHGSAAFPDVEFVLQGENGIQIVLDGKTDIKKGVTYSKFETSPDTPFSTFEAILPAGPHSAFAPFVPENEKYNLCHYTLTIPTEITAQNGAEIHQTTPVEITGCHTKLAILTHKTKGHTLTLTIYIPTPGRLTLTASNTSTHTLTRTITTKTTITLKFHINHTNKPTRLHLTLTPKPHTTTQQTTQLTLTPPTHH
jgi:hypothetical protein